MKLFCLLWDLYLVGNRLENCGLSSVLQFLFRGASHSTWESSSPLKRGAQVFHAEVTNSIRFPLNLFPLWDSVSAGGFSDFGLNGRKSLPLGRVKKEFLPAREEGYKSEVALSTTQFVKNPHDPGGSIWALCEMGVRCRGSEITCCARLSYRFIIDSRTKVHILFGCLNQASPSLTSAWGMVSIPHLQVVSEITDYREILEIFNFSRLQISREFRGNVLASKYLNFFLLCIGFVKL